jgi:KUP system potassium uptake protein
LVLVAYYGYIGVPHVEIIIKRAKELGLDININEASFFISKHIPISLRGTYMNVLRRKLFILLSKNALGLTDFFKIPYRRVVELGHRFEV